MTPKAFEAVAAAIPGAKTVTLMTATAPHRGEKLFGQRSLPYDPDVETILPILLFAGLVAVLVRLYFKARYLVSLPRPPFDPMREGMIEGVPVLNDGGGSSGDFDGHHHSHGDHGGDGGGHGH